MTATLGTRTSMTDNEPESSVSVRRSHDVVVVRPRGGLDAALADELRSTVLDTSGPVVIDLDECVLIDPASLERLAADPALPETSELAIACRRLSCRQLLVRSGIGDHVAIFGRLEDALQAREFARSGYGTGWGTVAGNNRSR